jgi:L-Ala-D/L-Glu epimerase
MRTLSLQQDSFRIRGGFTIARGSRTHAHVLMVTLQQDGARGRGECTPYARYGESLESVSAQIESLRGALEEGMDRAALQSALPAGAARNAVDCALWDLEAKLTRTPAHVRAGFGDLAPVDTAFTLSLDTPQAMAKAAHEHRDRPLLKIKLGGEGDADRMRAVCGHAGRARIIVDANEAWSPDVLWDWLDLAASLGIALVEQPLPAADDGLLSERPRPLPVCADESAHDRAGLHHLIGRYDVINIKLDKTGGLTEALELEKAARQAGLGVFIGCMMGSSLAMAPAFMLAGAADYVDLDAPLLLDEDRTPALDFEGSSLNPPPAILWG